MIFLSENIDFWFHYSQCMLADLAKEKDWPKEKADSFVVSQYNRIVKEKGFYPCLTVQLLNSLFDMFDLKRERDCKEVDIKAWKYACEETGRNKTLPKWTLL